MTDNQRESAGFEDLSERIVRHIFKGTDAIIKRTRKNKDGGYDIVVECGDGQRTQRAYFECKLRSKNLNLRDIAANVIIAYNEGAVALVAFTNHNFTVQTDEHLTLFFKKAVLNIKIVMGEEVNQLVKRFDIPISDTLSKLIGPTRSNRDYVNSLLQIDFSKENIHNQIFLPLKDRNIVLEQLTDRQLFALTTLKNGGPLVVYGLLGVGKRKFVESIAMHVDGISVWIDASLHQTQERILMDVLLSIWGIPVGSIFGEFSDTHIDTIIENLEERGLNPKTVRILRQLLGDARICGVADEEYNVLFCNYVVEMLQTHKGALHYLFVFENLAYAKNEIFVFLSYLIKKLSFQKTPCVVIQDTEEYEPQRTIDLHSAFGYLPHFVPMSIEIYTKDEAIAHICFEYPKIPMIVAKEIVEQAGTRKANITMFLEYLQSIGVSFSNHKRVAEELQVLQPNSVPTIMNKIMHYYKQRGAEMLFDTLFLLSGKISEKLCSKLAFDVGLIDQLTRGGILSYYQGHFVCANSIVRAILDSWGYPDSPRLRRLAKDILQVSSADPSVVADDTKAHLFWYIGDLEQALDEFLAFMNYLENEKQFDALIDCCDSVIRIYRQLNRPIEQLKWMIYQLKIIVIKKDILTPRAQARLNELGKALNYYAYLNLPHYFVLAYDYFTFTIYFKNGHYNTEVSSGLKMREYFDKIVNGIETDNFEDWLGRICNRYVLCVKESKGYDAALSAYVGARKALPESDQLWRGYISHLACMNLHSAPGKAFEYYEQIINFSIEKKSIYTPFHEYVDRAMSMFLVGDLVLAETLTRYAVNICESNSILDEWGRGLNILGCILVCQGRDAEAKALFKESLEMLKISGYKLYSWRSQLNYIHMELSNGDDYDFLANELNDAYNCFMSQHKAKLTLLLANENSKIEQLRDYHALLAFALYRSKLSNHTDCSVEKDFQFGSYLNRYQSDLGVLLNDPSKALPNSFFYRKNMIMMIG